MEICCKLYQLNLFHFSSANRVEQIHFIRYSGMYQVHVMPILSLMPGHPGRTCSFSLTQFKGLADIPLRSPKELTCEPSQHASSSVTMCGTWAPKVRYLLHKPQPILISDGSLLWMSRLNIWDAQFVATDTVPDSRCGLPFHLNDIVGASIRCNVNGTPCNALCNSHGQVRYNQIS